MLINTSNNLLLNKIEMLCVFLLLALFCVSEGLFAKPLPLTTVDTQKNSASVAHLKVNDNIELLRYSKELQVQSQIIAKDYFYIAQGLRMEQAKRENKESIHIIDKILGTLSVSIKNQDIGNILAYFNEINREMKVVWNAPYSVDNGSQVIDYSETIYEGSQSIIDYLLKKTNSDGDSLYNDILQQRLVLQRISKFYIAYQAGVNDKLMLDRLAESVAKFEAGLVKMGSHKFSDDEQEFAYTRLRHYWAISKKFYEGMKKGELTLIVFISTDHMVSYLDKILSFEE